MWGMIGPLVARLRTAHLDLAGSDLELLTRTFGRTSFVYLWRGDTVAQAVSWARAEQTGHWQREDIVKGKPHFDFDQIHSCVQTIDEHNAAWRDWFAPLDIQPHVVRYEDLVADLAGVTRSPATTPSVERPSPPTLEVRPLPRPQGGTAAGLTRWLCGG